MTINGIEPSRRVSSLLKGLFRQQRSILFSLAKTKKTKKIYLLITVTYLGITIPVGKEKKNIFELNFANTVNKIRSILNVWGFSYIFIYIYI